MTGREREVLARAQSGAPVAQIAGSLHLGAGTVRNHLSSAIGKTGEANRIAAAHLAREQGWIQARSHPCGRTPCGCPL